MLTITAIITPDGDVDISTRTSTECHPINDTLGYPTHADVYAFGLAMGMTPHTLPENYRTCDIPLVGVHARRAESGEQCVELWDLVIQNLGLFTQFLAWRVARRAYLKRQARSADLGHQMRDTGPLVAASSSLLASGSDIQNIDWISSMTSERPATIKLPEKGGQFKDILLQLPPGMCGKVCEAYQPSVLVAKAYLGAASAVQQACRSALVREQSQRNMIEDTTFRSAMAIASDVLSTPGWSLEGTKLVYSNRIVATKFQYNNKIFAMPEELEGYFYIDRVEVDAGPIIANCQARGRHPHVNANERLSELCVGTLAGAPIQQVTEIPCELETINVHSMYGSKAARLVRYLTSISGGPEFGEEFPSLREYLVKAYANHNWVEEVFVRGGSN